MNLYNFFRDELLKALPSLFPNFAIDPSLQDRMTMDPPKDVLHGDLSTNAALILSKSFAMPAPVLAECVQSFFANHPLVLKAEIAGPGFVNITLTPLFWHEQIRFILNAEQSYGESKLGQGKTINLEYASVNPTGPLHIGHCRVTIVADILGNILKKAGYTVIREYYINDSGGQARVLAQSVYQRYLEILKQPSSGPLGYVGAYLIPVAQALVERDGSKWVGMEESAWMDSIKDFAIDHMMQRIKHDLHLLGIYYDVFTSEKSLVLAGKVDEAFKKLYDQGLIYEGILEAPKGKTPEDWEPREQTLFRSSAFGDDTDRPLKKSDGSWTYFANDIAYHFDKFQRGASNLIDVLGADHGGYVKRITAALTALTQGKGHISVKLCQMVRFIDKGHVLKMSKRSGIFVTVQEALEKVGRDVMRFMMVTRKNDAPLDFDFDKVVEQTRDNPVFYVQYAHARCHSIQRHLKETFPQLDIGANTLAHCVHDTTFQDEDEIRLIQLLATWPRTIELAALAQEPHRIAFYLYDVSSGFHALWNKGRNQNELRFVLKEDALASQQRFALVEAVRIILASGLNVLGVQPVEEMRDDTE